MVEAVKQREEERRQWAEQSSRADAELSALRTSLEALERQSMEVARQESELASLREAEHVSQEALEKERMEVARLERELAVMKEAELAAVQVSHDASERDRAEIVRLESELASMREAVEHASQDAPQREKSEVEKLERELASLKEEQEDSQRKGEILAEIWRHLRPLAPEDVQSTEELPFPADFSLVLDAVQSIETQLMKLRDESSEIEENCAELTDTMETLQGKKMCLGSIFFMKFSVLIPNIQYYILYNNIFYDESLIFRATRQKKHRTAGNRCQDTRAGAANRNGQCQEELIYTWY